MGKPKFMRYFAASVGASDECWEWAGRINRYGYGQHASITAYRRVYELVVGPVASGLHLDHLCRNKKCVNPSHLEPVTGPENVRRANAVKRALPTCVNGHPRTPENTFLEGRSRRCRICQRAAVARYVRRRWPLRRSSAPMVYVTNPQTVGLRFQ